MFQNTLYFNINPMNWPLSSKLVDMVKLYKIEILHVHYAIPHAYAGYMAKQMLKDEGLKLWSRHTSWTSPWLGITLL
jgi:hypothetical protein